MPILGVTSNGVMSCTTSESVTSPSSLVWTRAPVPRPLPAYGLRLGQAVFAGCGQPLLGLGLSRRYLCESCLTCLDPYPGGSESALTRFFLSDIGLSCVRTRSALHKFPCSDLSTDPYFGAAVIRSCLGPPVCSPPRSLLPLCDDAANSCTRRVLALRVPPLACTSFTG